MRAAGLRWLSAAALGALLAATLLGWWWAWGLWFLHWTAYGFATGRTFVLWTVTREEQPPLFWAAQAVWLVLAALFAFA